MLKTICDWLRRRIEFASLILKLQGLGGTTTRFWLLLSKVSPENHNRSLSISQETIEELYEKLQTISPNLTVGLVITERASMSQCSTLVFLNGGFLHFRNDTTSISTFYVKPIYSQLDALKGTYFPG